MNFRPLSITDLPAAMELEHSMLPSPAWLPSGEKNQRKIIENGLTFGLFDQDKLIGKVGFFSEKEGEYEVHGMIIDDKHRRKGKGKLLLDYALNTLVEKVHPKKTFLFTYPKNSAAIALYTHCGFAIKETILNKYGRGMHRIRMEKIFCEKAI